MNNDIDGGGCNDQGDEVGLGTLMVTMVSGDGPDV